MRTHDERGMDGYGKTKALLSELKVGLLALYGKRLENVFLYGSYARNEEDPESDVDVLVVLDVLDHYGAEIERTGPLVSELSLRYDLSISRVFVSRSDWMSRESPFLLNAREEAIPV